MLDQGTNEPARLIFQENQPVAVIHMQLLTCFRAAQRGAKPGHDGFFDRAGTDLVGHADHPF